MSIISRCRQSLIWSCTRKIIFIIIIYQFYCGHCVSATLAHIHKRHRGATHAMNAGEMRECEPNAYTKFYSTLCGSPKLELRVYTLWSMDWPTHMHRHTLNNSRNNESKWFKFHLHKWTWALNRTRKKIYMHKRQIDDWVDSRLCELEARKCARKRIDIHFNNSFCVISLCDGQ